MDSPPAKIPRVGSDEESTSPRSGGDTALDATSPEDLQALAGRLTHEMQFDHWLATLCAKTGVAQILCNMKDQGEAISEGDPLLIIGVDPTDATARAYFDSGNYGLNVFDPGYLAWPGGAPIPGGAMPAGVAAGPPHAFGRFLAMQPDVHDRSHGLFNVFYVANLERLHNVAPAVQREAQFRRLGPVVAGMNPGRVVEPPLLQVLTLDSFRGPPRLYVHFNQTV